MRGVLAALAVLVLGALIGLALEALVGRWAAITILGVVTLIGLYLASREEAQ